MINSENPTIRIYGIIRRFKALQAQGDTYIRIPTEDLGILIQRYEELKAELVRVQQINMVFETEQTVEPVPAWVTRTLKDAGIEDDDHFLEDIRHE